MTRIGGENTSCSFLWRQYLPGMRVVPRVELDRELTEGWDIDGGHAPSASSDRCWSPPI